MLGFDLGNAACLRRFQTQFDDLGKIGSGGFSHVHKVRCKRDGKIYALKTIKIKPSQYKGQIIQYIQKVLTQARVLSNLKHRNVLQYHGCWVSADLKQQSDQDQYESSQHSQQELQLIIQQSSQNSYGFSFEKASCGNIQKQQYKNTRKVKQNKEYKEQGNDNLFGTNLQKYKQIRVYLLSQLGQYSLQKHVHLRNKQYRKNEHQKRKIKIQNYKIIIDIIQGLSYIHTQKVIHRDIKLQNIIITQKKQCQIIDFGLAKRVRNFKSLVIEKSNINNQFNEDDQEDEKHSSSIGTRIFSSPQQINSQNYDYRTDIYSLGIVIGMLLSEYSTIHEQNQLLLNLRNRKLDAFNMDQKLKLLIYRCLGEQKNRPELKQLKNCVKILLKQEIQNLGQININQHGNSNVSHEKRNDKLCYQKIKIPLQENRHDNSSQL